MKDENSVDEQLVDRILKLLPFECSSSLPWKNKWDEEKMLNETEKTECANILRRLSRTDLFSLVDTITKKLIRPTSTDEAVEAILTYSENATELLQRRKLKREILFQYLIDKKVKVSFTANKQTLVIKILRDLDSVIDYDMLESSSFDDAAVAKSPPGPARTPSPNQVNIQIHNHFHSPGVSTQTHFHFGGANSFSPPSGNTANSQQSGDTVAQPSGSQQTTTAETKALGTKFVEWFYDIINSHNPVMGTSKEFGPQHFWDDVVMNVMTPSKAAEEFKGPIAVADCFLNYTKNEQLLFNANVSNEGVIVKSNPHGLVAIMVCGTVHRANECLGVFQQAFGIIRDPRYNDNWKIKMSKLEVNAGGSSAMPKLPSSAEQDLLAII